MGLGPFAGALSLCQCNNAAKLSNLSRDVACVVALYRVWWLLSWVDSCFCVGTNACLLLLLLLQVHAVTEGPGRGSGVVWVEVSKGAYLSEPRPLLLVEDPQLAEVSQPCLVRCSPQEGGEGCAGGFSCGLGSSMSVNQGCSV
jgi:hypothetical protein